MGHELEAVADAQDRDAEVEDPAREQGRAFLVDALRPAGQDDARAWASLMASSGTVEREDFGIDAELADLAGDELGVLRPEIEDEDFVH